MKFAALLTTILAATATSFTPTFLPNPTPPSTSLNANIAIFGASGLTASECVYQALNNGDKVFGLTRNPSNLVIPKGSGGDKEGGVLSSKDLTLIGGSASNKEDVVKIFEGNSIDGVVIALGGKTKDVGETMLTDSTRTILSAMKSNNVKRVSVITSIGAGDSKDQAPFMFKMLMATVMKNIFVDKNNQENLIRSSSDLEWCIIRPGGLTVEPPNGIINVIEGEAGSISRADVAQFCLDAVTVEDFPYIGKAPCISSVGGTSWVKDRSSKAREGM
ncbi:hypothetical protein TrLO_g4518 [Triparma laevis f. longispina]|uniref:NAD(P)-binding domain-containing protein n=1 Tax=Triparma laevis f. longispina TaxID=1714387 RepID=A0A9W6ZA04_9STRA|nr:hypothetical protein TrLO_g4518 [Triparma laevis f. longispina]